MLHTQTIKYCDFSPKMGFGFLLLTRFFLLLSSAGKVDSVFGVEKCRGREKVCMKCVEVSLIKARTFLFACLSVSACLITGC